MNQEILEYMNESLVDEAKFCTLNELPQSIGQALYLYGSNSDYDVLGFIDASEQQDGSKGMIITKTHVYFQFVKTGSFAYQDIISLSIEKHRHQNKVATIKTNNKTYVFKNRYLDQELFIDLLSKITGIEVETMMTLHEKIENYMTIVLKDIQNDEYEDVILTPSQENQIKDFFDNISLIQQMNDEDYQYEIEVLCKQALEFFDELELDSDEIDILIDIYQQITSTQNNEFDQAQSYYDDLMNKYRQGDPQTMNQIQSMMNMLGINEDELRGKSPEELQQYLYDLCDRFGVSRSMLEKMLKNQKVF